MAPVEQEQAQAQDGGMDDMMAADRVIALGRGDPYNPYWSRYHDSCPQMTARKPSRTWWPLSTMPTRECPL